MSYEPTNWKTGDVVTSQKLNKLEQGVAGANSGGSFAPDITDPQDGDTLVYNAAQQKWVNGAGGETAGGVFVVHATIDPDAQVPNTLITQETAGEVEEAALSNKAIIICDKDFDDGFAAWYTTACTFSKDETADHLYTLVTSGGPISRTFTADTSDKVFIFVPNA